MSKIRIRARFTYTTTTAYDTVVDYTDDENSSAKYKKQTEYKIVDAPVTFTKSMGQWFWGSKTTQSFSSIKIFGATWARTDKHIDTPPKIDIYVVVDGVETKVYEGVAHSIQDLGEDIYEFKLQDLREQFNRPAIKYEWTGINPVDTYPVPIFAGYGVWGVEPVMYDYATQKLVFSEFTALYGTAFYFAVQGTDGELLDNGDPLVYTTDYTLASPSSGSTYLLVADLVSSSFGIITGGGRNTSVTYRGLVKAVESVLWRVYDDPADIPTVTNNAGTWLATNYNNDCDEIGIYADSDETGQDLLTRFAESINGFWYVNGAGDVIFDTLRLPENETAVHTFDQSNILSKTITTDVDVAKNATFKVGSRRNYRPLKYSECAMSLTEDEKQLQINDYRYVSTYADVVTLATAEALPYKSNNELTTATSVFYRKDMKDYFRSDIQTKDGATRLLWHLTDLLFEQVRRFYKLEVSVAFTDLELGMVVALDYNGYNLNLIITNISANIREGTTKLELWG